MKASRTLMTMMTTAALALPALPAAAQERPGMGAQEERASGTVAALLEQRPEFSLFAKALKAAGMEDVLSRKGSYTILAPTDAAFSLLGEGVLEELLMPENRERLVQLLSGHVVPQKITSTAITTDEVRTLQGSSIVFNREAGVVWVGRAEILKADIPASNGVIHAINMVLEPDEQ